MIIDPQVTSLLERRAELEAQEGSAGLALSHLLRAFLFRPLTPALEGHHLRAAALADEYRNSAIADLHLILAVLEDRSRYASQVLASTVDRDAVIHRLHEALRTFAHVEDEARVPLPSAEGSNPRP